MATRGFSLSGMLGCSTTLHQHTHPACFAARLGHYQASQMRSTHTLQHRLVQERVRRRAPATWTCQAAQTAKSVSTVKIITQGRHVTVTPAIKEYVVRTGLLDRPHALMPAVEKFGPARAESAIIWLQARRSSWMCAVGSSDKALANRLQLCILDSWSSQTFR